MSFRQGPDLVAQVVLELIIAQAGLLIRDGRYILISYCKAWLGLLCIVLTSKCRFQLPGNVAQVEKQAEGSLSGGRSSEVPSLVFTQRKRNGSLSSHAPSAHT